MNKFKSTMKLLPLLGNKPLIITAIVLWLATGTISVLYKIITNSILMDLTDVYFLFLSTMMLMISEYFITVLGNNPLLRSSRLCNLFFTVVHPVIYIITAVITLIILCLHLLLITANGGYPDIYRGTMILNILFHAAAGIITAALPKRFICTTLLIIGFAIGSSKQKLFSNIMDMCYELGESELSTAASVALIILLSTAIQLIYCYLDRKSRISKLINTNNQ